MNVQVRQLSAADFEEAMEMMNLAFFAGSPTQFQRLVPKLYRPTDELMSCNYAAIIDGSIKAVVGVFPLDWHIDRSLLRVAGIGGVCTHPDYRQRGLMKLLMPHCMHEARIQGYHLSWLGGQRQRYAYFGYETCGVGIKFNLNRNNIRHNFESPSQIRFEVIQEDHSDRLQQACDLHAAQPIHVQRPEADVYHYLSGWGLLPHAALEAGKMVGYLVAGSDPTINELVARDHDTALRMAHAWVENGDAGKAQITVGPLEGGMLSSLGDISESVTIGHAGNWQVFDWVSVVDILLKARHSRSPLIDGVVSLSIESYGVLEVEVGGGEAGCRMIEGVATIHCDTLLAHRLLFGPLRPSQVMELPAGAETLDGWCPLPLYMAPQDRV